MYEAFYGLTERPFNLTPDPRFLFLSDKHKEAFAHLLYGIKSRTGFVMVSGEIGTGKTTICRSLLNQLDPETEVAFIFNPCLSPEELLRKINEDFGIESRAGTVKDLIDELNQYLLERSAEGKNCVLVIDEAQNLAPSVLEQVRLLSNLETETQKLLQIVLIGQPELAHSLELPELRQLNQRITARYHLKALDMEETVQYILCRLRVAGGRKKVRFTKSACRTLHRISGGTPRVINAVCDRALLIGYTKETFIITAGIIRQAAKEIRGESPPKQRNWGPLFRRLMPNPSLLVTAALVLILAFYIMPARNANRSDDTPVAAMRRDVTAPPGRVAISPDAVRATESPSTPSADTAPPPKAEPPKAADASAAMDRLLSLTPAAAREAAIAGVLRAFNKALIGAYPEGDGVAGVAAWARANGLDFEEFSPTADELIAIDLPSLALMGAGAKTFWVALTGTDGNNVQVTVGGNETAPITKEQFRGLYKGQALAFWQDSAPATPALKDGMSGPAVRLLQQGLHEKGLLSEITGTYDEKTHRAVSKLQAAMGLRIDGIAGKQVRMALSRGRQAASEAPAESPAPAAQAAPQAPAKRPDTKPVARPAAPAEAPKELAAPAGNPLPDISAPVEAAAPQAATQQNTGPMASGAVHAEALPPVHDDVLAPPKTPAPKEVTPPAPGGAPLMPSEAKPEGNGDGKQSG